MRSVGRDLFNITGLAFVAQGRRWRIVPPWENESVEDKTWQYMLPNYRLLEQPG
ncbi:hypothetical protein ANO14919_020860 [Xylariales sp. No.14919]|nr:hypothetical protein ANO14919_020860 [Xylariales sp. No.14919]